MNQSAMALQEKMDVSFGPLKGTIFGGPFRAYVPGTRRLVGIKMAQEINHPHDFSIPTRDFDVPNVKAMEKGVLYAIDMLLQGKDIYVGCMGGTGRTGLFMGCMAKVMFDYAVGDTSNPAWDELKLDPVKYVRREYRRHAIETDEQMHFVRSFDTTSAVRHLKSALQPKTVEVIKEVEVFLSPFDWILRNFWHPKKG